QSLALADFRLATATVVEGLAMATVEGLSAMAVVLATAMAVVVSAMAVVLAAALVLQTALALQMRQYRSARSSLDRNGRRVDHKSAGAENCWDCSSGCPRQSL